MNTGVGKQNATATAKTTSETHVHPGSSLSQMRPSQAWRLVPQLHGVHGGRRGSNLSNVRIGEREVKTPTVLLILDEPQDLETYGRFLRDRGYETLMCNSPGEGLNSLETESVSMVIVSQATLTFQGRQVLERSLRLHPEVPVVVVARVLDMHYYLEAMDLGATDYLERPEPQDLAWVVDTQMRRVAAV